MCGRGSDTLIRDLSGVGRTLSVWKATDQVMEGFHRAGHERINAFPVDEEYWFKQYFDDAEVFAEVRSFYNPAEYRFEIPAARLGEIQSLLAEHEYGLVVVEAVDEFVVVKRKYTTHPRAIFRGAVLQRSVDQFNCFVMRDQAAVDQAIELGAMPLEEAPVEFSL